MRIQEQASIHSTISYRPPELFHVKVDSKLDGRTDVWGLGMSLRCCLISRYLTHGRWQVVYCTPWRMVSRP